MPTEIQKRATLKGLNISFGLLSVSGNVLTPTRANAKAAESFKMVCPLHPETPHGVKQRYVCINDTEGSAFTPDTCLKGKEVGDKMVIVPKDAIAAAREGGDIPEKTLVLRAHPFDSTHTFASGPAYVFQPEASSQFYAALLSLIDGQGLIQTESGPKMLVGLVSMRKGSESFVRLDRWGDQLIIREMVRPEDLDKFSPVDSTVDVKLLDMARQLVEATAEDFDPSAYRASVRERYAELMEQAANGEIDIAAFQPTTEHATEDMAALLAQSLELAKNK